MNCLVISIEGLSTSLCGVYGSSLAKTPCLDELAMRGEVLDQCFLDSLETRTQLNSLWTGRHHLQGESAGSDRSTIWRQANERGIPACLITDSAEVAEHAEAQGCQEAILIQAPSSTEPADTVEDCSVMALFITAAELLSQRTGVVWVHSTGLHADWDAPVELRNSFVDPEDPDPPAEVRVPAFAVTADTDPDAIVGWGQVASAQASVIDEGLATLLASATASSGSWSNVLVGLGGVALGEHGYVGSLIPPSRVALEDAPALFGEVLSCVAVVANPDESSGAPGRRRPEMFQLPDLGATLQELAGLDPVSDSPESAETAIPTWGRSVSELGLPSLPCDWPAERSIACAAHEGRLWFRCPAWSMQTDLPAQDTDEVAASESAEATDEVDADADAKYMDSVPIRSLLFVKPEDRWEVNDIADRRADIVELLREHALKVLDGLRDGKRELNFELEEELVNLLR